MHAIATDTRVRIAVSGVVQGVGFRPFVYNLAATHCLVGYVRNIEGAVEIELQGPLAAIDAFVEQLTLEPPPLAHIESIATESIAPLDEWESHFEIRQSAAASVFQPKFLPADAATCQECLSELFDRNNRRFRYPFINCTNCGPRFTIISSLPYDRPSTTMAPFSMCVPCQTEYRDPANRRFHAQPNACSKCGPSLTYIDATERSELREESALAFTLEQLGRGRIVAIKGLGGFHLMCDATDKVALQRLRKRKRRTQKPFAVMMSNLQMVRKYCHCSEEEERELTSTSRPIVLLRKQDQCALPDDISPGLDCLGVMLPYTPVHHLLISDYNSPLVATSANLSEEPIAIDNEEAMQRLTEIADGFLLHDRAIYSRYDDSVIRIIDTSKTTLRRARGIAPLPIKLPFKARAQALACGAHLKNTICFVHNDQAYVSQHIGDLENIETSEHFERTLNTYKSLFGFTPAFIAHDCHPDYVTTAFAHDLAARDKLLRFEVQHHHAHIVSCMIEHGLTQPVIGVAFDGLGYGLDGTLWGGEFLLASLSEYQRLAHLEPVHLPGSSLGIKQPWRMALSYLYTSSPANTGSLANFAAEMADLKGKTAVELVKQQIHKRLNSPLTSSCGRLFDAMSALLGICHEAEYEGQAAIELETLANQATGLIDLESKSVYPFEIAGDGWPLVIKTRAILEAAYHEYLEGAPANLVAAKFHHAVAHVIHAVCVQLRELTGIQKVCVSGGVFQNALLLRLSRRLLAIAGFQLFFPQQLPANDGGLSLGQAVIALAKAEAITLPAS
jgi:hydrogenase maturation protein HypF